MTLRELVKERIDAANGDLVIPILAAEVCGEHASEVDEWIAENRQRFVGDLIAEVVRRSRSASRRSRRAVDFDEAVEAGDPKRLCTALDEWVSIEKANFRRRLRDMTIDDVRFAASEYEGQTKGTAFEAAVLRQIERRMKDGQTVGEVIDADAYQAIRQVVASKLRFDDPRS